MASALSTTQEELEQLLAAIPKHISSADPLSIAHNNWSFPGLSRSDLEATVGSALALTNQIDENGLSAADAAALSGVQKRVAFLRNNTLLQMWGNPPAAAPAFMLTMDAVWHVLSSMVPAEDPAKTAAELRRLKTRTRAIEATISDLEPRASELAGMVARIKDAHDAADQLPTDLATLAESRLAIATTLEEARVDQARARLLREEVESIDARLKASAKLAENVVARSESAYRAATTQGLAAAFAERSSALDLSTWVWVGGLILALSLGGYFGSHQLSELTGLARDPNTPGGIIALNLALSVLSVAAPVWFAWLATKQIGQRFRLSEDYAFKAAVARSYEGFRSEAARVDTNLESALLSSALARLDEEPLRLVEAPSHGSPWHELASSDVVRDAVRSVPGFTQSVVNLAKRSIDGLVSTRTLGAGSAPLSESAKPGAQA